jgi:two-component system sensor histidine kinase TctE
MTETVHVSGSLRNRLMITLIGGAAMLAVLLFVVVRSYAAQVAQQGQDSILRASVISILDAAVLRNGRVEIDIPYAAFSMLSTTSDDRVFYAVHQDDVLVSGYDGLIDPATIQGTPARFSTRRYQGTPVRLATASRVLVGATARSRITVSMAQTQERQPHRQLGGRVLCAGGGAVVLGNVIHHRSIAAPDHIGGAARAARS